MLLALVVHLSLAQSAEPPRGAGVQVGLAPVVAPIPVGPTQHWGSELFVGLRIVEGLTLSMRGQWSWLLVPGPVMACPGGSGLCQAPGAQGPFLRGGGFATLEYAPLRAALSKGLVLEVAALVGVGAFTSEVVLRGATQRADGSTAPPSTAPTEVRPGFLGGLSARLVAGRFFVRLELRDLVASGAVPSVAGCSADDLSLLESARQGGRPVNGASVSLACRAERFDGTSPDGERRADDLPLALSLVQTPAPALVHVVTANLAVGLSF
jgi:hypothetical protein